MFPTCQRIFQKSDELHTSSPTRFCAVAARNMLAERILLSHAKSLNYRVLSHPASTKGSYATRNSISTKAQSLNPPPGFNMSHGPCTTMETHISNGHDARDSQEPSRSHGVTVDGVDFNWCTVRMYLETFEKTEGIAIDLGLLLFPWWFS